MAIRFSVGGVSTVIPGVYDTFRVLGSVTSVASAGRSVLLIGEAEEGVPGADLDLRFNFFTDFQSLRDFYKSGPLVDAARTIFSNQPAQQFTGSVQRVYVYKTNDSSRAEKAISSPAGYGKIVAARYGEAGNQIKSQIKTGQAESKPSKTFLYLPSSVSRDFKVSVNGALSAALTVAADGVASDFVSAISVSGLSVTGGTARTISASPFTVDSTASGDLLTLTKNSGTGDFGTAAQVGDIAYIAAGLAISGTGDANSGAYLVTEWSATSVTLKQLKHVEAAGEGNAEAFSTLAAAVLAVGDLKVNAPVTMTVTATTASGSAASLEVLGLNADKFALGNLVKDTDLANILVNSTSTVAKISASVPSSGKLAVSLSTGSWSSTPKAGDIVRIKRGSLLQGATLKNVGLMIVESANSQSMTLSHLYSGMTTEAVAQVSLNGANDTVQHAASFVSNSSAARRIDSSAERKVKVEASRTSDGASFPTTLIGGNAALEISYQHASATAATVSIDAQRIMTIDVTGGSLADVTVNTKKYQTLQELVDFLNTQANISARIPDQRLKSLSPSALDMVSNVGCLTGNALHAYNGKIKKDYSDWKNFLEDNFSLIAFGEGSMSLKTGLPDAEAAAGFLTGAAIGSTNMASVQNALDAGLKIDVRMVIPLFSRDAQYDIEDGLTDTGSTYTIDSVNAAVKAHVATASSTLVRKERFGHVSWDGSFSDAVQKVGEMAYERTSMAFQRVKALNANGETKSFLPWMAQCCAAAGRAQSVAGTSLLRKPFLLSDVYHIGQQSLYSDTLTQDFEPEDRGELEEAIAAGLLVFRSVSGFGVRMESPDLSTRSRESDPEGWVWERMNVLSACDEVRQALRNVLENFIGERTSDVPEAVIKKAMQDVIDAFVSAGVLLKGSVNKIVSLGNSYTAEVSITPVEAIEAMVLEVLAERSV